MVPANPYPRNKYNQPLFCYIKKYIFYLLALVLAGCTHSGGIKPANTGIQVLQIDWKHISDKLDYAPMVEDSILMFQLEATNECLIGEVTKLIYQNDLIYIADNLGKRVFVFDTTSKLQADIHRVGNGPGEYTHISCFAVHGTEMVIFDHFLGKFFFFDAEGRFLREKPADGIWTEDLFCIGDKLYLPNSSRTHEGCYHLFALDLKEGNKLEKHLPF